MKNILLMILFITSECFASIVGITTHPLKDEAKVLSAEMTGYMSERNEMGAGVRYTQDLGDNLLDVNVAGAQDSRSMTLGAGMDFEILQEDMNQPRVAIKPYAQQMTFEGESATLIGAAPSLRKGFAVGGSEIFPYVALPNGVRLDGDDQELTFYSSLTFGASTTIPESQERLVISLEANKNLGASSDYVGALVSWIWN